MLARLRLAEAKQEYDSLCGYAGFEARTRYALTLLRNGEIAVLEGDREWLKVAKANL